MPAKHHKTPNGKVSACGATVRRCKYKLVNADGSPTNITGTAGSVETSKTTNKPAEPVFTLKNYMTPDMLPDVDYDYEGYGCDGCYGCETGNDYCRGRSYSGLHVTGLDANKILDQYFTRKNGEEYPEEFYTILENSGILEEDNWEVNTSPGYYGDEIDPPIFLEDNPMPVIIDLYKTGQINKAEPLNDSEGYISYLQGLGYTPSAGATFKEAIKEHVLSKPLPSSVRQNVQDAQMVVPMDWRTIHSMIHETNKIEKAAKLNKKLLTPLQKNFLTKIKADNTENVEPTELPTHANLQEKPPIVGILVKNKTNNRFFLVEGAGMYKTLLENSNDFHTTFPKPDLAKYRFIVLQ